ncbi:MAG: fused MFS/spermidine synthase [Thermodesulfobacteriota bacterium]
MQKRMSGIILVMFFLSGFTGLVYQVVWTRMFILVFGATTLAVSTVLTCFFTGLALGSYAVGRWIDKRKEFLKWYGVAELFIGIFAIFFPLLLQLVSKSYLFIAHVIQPGFYQASLIKFLFSLLILSFPTTLMGATLPILGKFLVRKEEDVAGSLGGLYAINTFGAVLGTVATGFILMPMVGIRTILFTAGIINILIGLYALKLNRDLKIKEEGDIGEACPIAPIPHYSNKTSSFYLSLVLWGFAVSGFTALAYEVVWTRVIELVFTGTIYAFTTVLATFLIGIAVGSAVCSRFLDRLHSPDREGTLFALVEICIGLTTILLIFLYNGLPDFWIYKKIFETNSWGNAIVIKSVIAFIFLFPPTFLFGATFPIVCKLYSHYLEELGQSVGKIYSVNTIGGIFGSFLTGFVLIPFIGMQNSVVLMGCINLLIGISLLVFNPYAGKVIRFSTVTVSIVLLSLLLGFLPENMVRSIYSGFLGDKDKMIYYKEGISATVMISKRKGGNAVTNKRLWVNGNQATAVFYEGLQINRFQGVLPMVLHPEPKDVLVICFGSGTTFGTLSLFDVNGVDNVEIAKTVTKGAKYFTDENQDVLNNPKSNIIIDDGRSYLLTTTKKYDVITQEPMHPSLVGVVNLYTKEYYELAKNRLKPGGIISQWIPLYNLSVKDVKTLTRTFQSVFPHTSIWITNVDIFLIGSPEKIEVDYERIKKRVMKPHIQKILREIDLEDPLEFINTFMMNEDQVRAYSSGMPVMDDNWPYIEFYGPKSLLASTVLPNIIELSKYSERVMPYLKFASSGTEDNYNRLERKFLASEYNLKGRGYISEKNFKKASKSFTASLKIDPFNRNSLHYKKKLRFIRLGL